MAIAAAAMMPSMDFLVFMSLSPFGWCGDAIWSCRHGLTIVVFL